MRRFVLIGLSVALGACTQHETPVEGPVPPADAPAEMTADPALAADWTRDINAVGTEPFWSLQIRPGQMTLSGADRQDLVADRGEPALDDETAVFTGAAGSGALKATLTVASCSDGMSDLTYPYTARVETGAETLEGCAAPADAWPRQPDP